MVSRRSDGRIPSLRRRLSACGGVGEFADCSRLHSPRLDIAQQAVGNWRGCTELDIVQTRGRVGDGVEVGLELDVSAQTVTGYGCLLGSDHQSWAPAAPVLAIISGAGPLARF